MFVKGIFGEGEGYNGMALFVSTKINEHRIGLKNEKTNMVLNFIFILQTASPETSTQAESC